MGQDPGGKIDEPEGDVEKDGAATAVFSETVRSHESSREMGRNDSSGSGGGGSAG